MSLAGGRGFAKLDGGIVDSTLWMQPHDVLRVWIAMLAKCDSYGLVRASVPSMAHLCMVPIERLEQILHILTSPDPYSRTADDDGRRLRAIEGGWLLVNYIKYRELVQTKPQSHAERQRKYRERLNERDRRVTGDDTVTPTVTRDAEEEAEAKAEKREEAPQPAAARARRLPEDWKPSDELVAWAREKHPSVDVKLEADRFVDHFRAKAGRGGTMLDWSATFRNWIRRSQEFAPRGAAQPSPAGSGAHRMYTPEKRERRDPSAGAPAEFSAIAASLRIKQPEIT